MDYLRVDYAQKRTTWPTPPPNGGGEPDPGEFISTESLSQVTLHDVTWYFDGNYDVGYYVNGDPFVVSPSGVAIVNIDPLSVNQDGWYRHGSMINPENGVTQGYDSETDGIWSIGYSLANNVGMPGGNTLNAQNPLHVSSGQSLCSSVSKSTPGNRNQLLEVNILTVVSSPPLSGSFRPPYTNVPKESIWSYSDVRWDRLLSRQVDRARLSQGDLPNLESVTNSVSRAFIDHGQSGGIWYYLTPDRHGSTYGRSVLQRMGDAFLTLLLDFPQEDLTDLLIHFIQNGIDIYGLRLTGQWWPNNGGIFGGRKLPVLVAGWLLDNEDMVSSTNTETPSHFMEDLQTNYVTQSMIDNQDYPPELLGSPEWSIRFASWLGVLPPGYSYHHGNHAPNPSWGAGYRSMNVGAAGPVLAARIAGLKDLWNWPPLFEYIDRLYAARVGGPGEDPAGTHGHWAVQTNGITKLTLDMWEEYRNDDVSGETSMLTSVSQYGITWTFNHEYECGHYVTGDWFVVDPGGGVSITSISPAPEETAAGWRNGSQIDPSTVTSQGYDSRNTRYGYNAALNVALGISEQSPLVITGTKSLVSSRGRDGKQSGLERWIGEFAVLTVVSSVPGADSFRPPLYNVDKTMPYTWSHVNASLLKTLAPVGTMPSWEEAEARTTNPYCVEYTATGTTIGGANFCNQYSASGLDGRNLAGYGPEFTRDLTTAALMVNCDVPISTKKKTVAGLIQRGIDTWAAETSRLASSRLWPWPPNGQIFGGRKLPVMFAGWLLNIPEMFNVGDTKPLFHDDAQLFIAGDTEINRALEDYQWDGRDITAGRTQAFTEDHRGMPDWAIRYSVRPQTANAHFQSIYRQLNGRVTCAQALAVLIMDWRDAWNWEPAFHYSHRYMSLLDHAGDPFGYTVDGTPPADGQGPGSHRSYNAYWAGAGSWCADMFDQYWGNYYQMPAEPLT